ncbi:hypothetical protein GCM10027615_37270 [Plantactinospora veratri]
MGPVEAVTPPVRRAPVEPVHAVRVGPREETVRTTGSPAWAMVMDRFRPDRYDVIGAVICLAGVAVIMYAPRS